MNDVFENKLSMYKTVVGFLNTNASKIAALTALTDAFTEFKVIVTSITLKDEEARTARTGHADVKATKRKTLEENAYTIASALFALGSKTNDDRLKQLAAFTKSKFAILRDTQLTTDVTTIKNLADTNAAALAGYGITPVMIANLDTQLNTFDGAVESPREGAVQGAAALEEVDTLFKNADVILKEQMDKIMVGFSTSDTQFYNGYLGSREVIDLGVRHEKTDEEDPVNPVNPEE